MTYFRIRHSIGAIILLLLFSCPIDALSAQLSAGIDPGIPDTLYIGSDSVTSPNPGIIPIRLVTDETLAALEITLIHDGTGITLDSFSFEGSPVSNYDSKDAIVDSNNIIIFVFAVAEPPIPAGNFLLGNLYFSYSTAPQIVTFDTNTFFIDPIEHSTTFSAESQVNFVPQVKNGTLVILDDCCIGSTGNIDNDIEQTPDIADLTFLVDHLFINFPDTAPCQ